ncbi:virulence-associated protein BptA [Borreliella turdi]|uniref:virulence-associated protein BptA n=1 Tax=Borreliella turdi TaxID=57863 RepID=UPI0023508A24|nr:protein BptA [Borreliella turdi]
MSKNILSKMVFFGLLLICIFLASLFYQQKENNVIYNKIVEKSLDNVFINETYTYLLKDDNLKELVFIKSEFMMPYVENIKNKNMTGYLVDAYRAMNPGYKFDFKVHDNKILGFKNVIFEGFEDARVSRHENDLPSEKWQLIKDFNIGDPNIDKKFFHLKFPFVVKNNLRVTLSKGFFKKIKKIKRLKITLISNEDREYKIDIENFLLKYNL